MENKNIKSISSRTKLHDSVVHSVSIQSLYWSKQENTCWKNINRQKWLIRLISLIYQWWALRSRLFVTWTLHFGWNQWHADRHIGTGLQPTNTSTFKSNLMNKKSMDPKILGWQRSYDLNSGQCADCRLHHLLWGCLGRSDFDLAYHVQVWSLRLLFWKQTCEEAMEWTWQPPAHIHLFAPLVIQLSHGKLPSSGGFPYLYPPKNGNFLSLS